MKEGVYLIVGRNNIKQPNFKSQYRTMVISSTYKSEKKLSNDESAIMD